MNFRHVAKQSEALSSNRARLSAVWLIYAREMRDQLRDRRTLFTIAVLPVVLYPLVGTLLLQIAQFTQQHPTSIAIVGGEHLTAAPPLIDDDGFVAAEGAHQYQLNSDRYTWAEVAGVTDVSTQAAEWVRSGKYDVAVLFPPAFSQPVAGSAADNAKAQVFYSVASDQSMIARDRVIKSLSDWRGEWIRERLTAAGVDSDLINPFLIDDIDTAANQTRETALWSKLLPFVMLIWAMTGAFYPAIDLVAGEKERGTLETLLCSPALRSEIVWGKLATVATFSMLTAILNAGSMLITSAFVIKQIGAGGGVVGAPPIMPMLWLLVALVPLSALFSALALAVAALARSSKEGQYYLMPLMMVTLPLVLLPMLPGTTLSIGTSLIPVTGMFLMVRALVEGQYAYALWHLPIVAGVTAGCLWLAVNWARRQFEDESVLFGGNEKWELRSWVRQLWRDRESIATPAQAYACGAIILVGLFFAKLVVTVVPTDLAGIAKLIVAPQIGIILAPAVLMAAVLTTSVRKGLRLRMPHWSALPVAMLLGVTLHPSYVMLAEAISRMYPISEQALASMQPFTEQISSAPWLTVVLLMAVVPAICEELAFRGFIFGGLVQRRGELRAVAVTALMFGISHGVLQQSIAATMMGLLLGYVALRTGSVLPGIMIHFTSNALSVSLARIATTQWQGVDWILKSSGPADVSYQPFWIVISMAIAITCLLYFSTLRSAMDQADPSSDPSLPAPANRATALAT
jgi:sodium transport system permease protein